MAEDVLQHHDGVVHHQADGSTRATSVSVLMLKPGHAISANAPISDTGIVTSGMMDARKVQEDQDHQAHSTTASAIVVYTDLIDRSMNTELSLATSTVTLAGRSRWIFSIS